jgi:hypothetical protein
MFTRRHVNTDGLFLMLQTLKTSVTPLLLVLRMHGSYARAADAPAGYLQVARTLLSMPEVDANKVAGDKVLRALVR